MPGGGDRAGTSGRVWRGRHGRTFARSGMAPSGLTGTATAIAVFAPGGPHRRESRFVGSRGKYPSAPGGRAWPCPTGWTCWARGRAVERLCPSIGAAVLDVRPQLDPLCIHCVVFVIRGLPDRGSGRGRGRRRAGDRGGGSAVSVALMGRTALASE